MKILDIIDIKPGEVRDLIEWARDYKNRGRDAACFVLAASNETILEWYNSLNDKFNGERIEDIRHKLKQGIVDDEVRKFRGEISHYTHEREYKPIIEQSIKFTIIYT